MKNGSSSSVAAANGGGGGGGLAIAERQKPSCVAALFQMLAKRKLFSSSSSKTKLLAPARAPKFPPGRPPGGGSGGEKTPVPKKRPLLLDSADHARSRSGHGINCSPPPSQDNNSREMSTPGVVARLMGLSSMPSTSHERPARATDSSEVDAHWNECSQGLPGSSRSMGASHQNQQKPGQLMDERHEHASQFNADSQALWSVRHHNHKVASPLRSPRSVSSRNKARLIEAAARVLEPGLQSRNRHRARRQARLEYPCNSDGVARAAAVMHNLPDQFSRDMHDHDAPMSGARKVEGTPLHKSTPSQWPEENGKKVDAARRPNQDMSRQVQPEGNSKVLPVSSSSEKARFKERDEMIFSATVADTYQDARKVQPRNVSRSNVASSPLKQNNLKQNALPIAARTEDPQHVIQRQKHRTGEQHVSSTGKDFVSLNKDMNNSSSLRSKGKVMDEIRMSHGSVQKKNLSKKGHGTNGLPSGTSNKPKLSTASPKGMEKDMIIAKGAGLVSEKPRATSPNYVRNDMLRQAEPCDASRCNDSDIVSFTFSSPMKSIPTSLASENIRGKGSAALGSPNGACPKRNSHRDCQNISSERELVSRKNFQGTSCIQAAEPVCSNRDELKNRDIPGGRVTSSLSEKGSGYPVLEKSSSNEFLRELDNLMHGLGDLPKPMESCETHKKHEANEKASTPSRSVPGGDRQRGILRSTYADENCTSGSPNHASDVQLKDRRRPETSTPPFSARDATTGINLRCPEPNLGQRGAHRLASAVQDGKLMMHGGELTSAVDLLLANVCSSGVRRPKANSKAFLLQTSESVLGTLTKNHPCCSKAAGENPLRNLASDLVTECLDSMCVRLCDSGYRSFAKLAVVSTTEERLADEVRKEVARCGGMAVQVQDLDDLVGSDVERAVVAGLGSFLHEVLRIVAQIERDLVQELVHEIGGLDMPRRL